jgi:5-methylcytosine-specific restriction endonuclease McrA
MSNGNGHRWSKFHWRDWTAEISLRTCGLAARGLWMEMLCVMHEGSPIGHLALSGNAITPRRLAVLAYCSEREVKKLLVELEAAGVFSRTEDGTIYCRRMVREASAAEVGAVEVRKKWGYGSSELAKATRAQRLAEARRKATHTPEQWLAMVDALGDRCLRCGQMAGDNGHGLVKDHIVPIYQGGSDGIENIQPMCRSCNAAKGPETTDHRPQDWRERLGERLGECLGADQKMPRSAPREPSHLTPTKNLEAESELEAEVESKKVSKTSLLSFPISEREDQEPALAARLAVKNLVGRVAGSLDSSAKHAPQKPPKRSVLQQQIAAITPGQAEEHEDIDPADRPRRGPVEPVRTVAEQLAALRGAA